jgi:hypothetical protein
VASYAELEAEPWWDREIVTSPMTALGLQLRAAYGTGADSFGIKGNNKHLSGGHRSQEWINNSAYCTNRTYTVQSGLSGDQTRYVSAFDFTPGAWGSADNRAKMKVLTKRVIDAMKAGLLDELDECFGTLDGVTVTGWNNDRDTTVTADSTHLDHIHCRFDRRYANDNAAALKVQKVMLGDMLTTDDVVVGESILWDKAANRSDPTGRNFADDVYKVVSASLGDEFATTDDKIDAVLAALATGFANLAGIMSQMQSQLAAIEAKIDALPGGGGGGFPTASTFSAGGTITWNPQA